MNEREESALLIRARTIMRLARLKIRVEELARQGVLVLQSDEDAKPLDGAAPSLATEQSLCIEEGQPC
jgi:hypothetical protein